MNDASTKTPSPGLLNEAAMHYDQFFGPLFFEPYAIEVVKRINPIPASVVLEIAAGTGRVTHHIRNRIPASVKLIASDISERMLAVAKKKFNHLEIDWQMIDARQLPFGDNSIDLVVCCFGYMFVPEKAKAFAEVYRVLKPGGQFLMTTWDKLENNAASYTSVSIAKKYLTEPLPESFYLATSMSDENIITTFLREAGFARISVEKKGLSAISANAKEAAAGLVQGGLIYEEIKKRNPAWIDEIKIKLENELAEKFGAAPMMAPLSALISEAWK